MAKAKATTKRTTRKRTPKKAAAGSRGILPQDSRLDASADDVAAVTRRIEEEGGIVLAAYREPLGGNPVLFASLPIDKVEPTPFQRDLSEAQHKKLAGVIDRTGLFLDPVIAITAPEKGFWTPNGRHRLAALQRLGARAVTALVVPRREIAWQILALNTEKAHNLRDKSLEVIRIYRIT
jgi:ParB family chromosome partitioning protein